MFGSYLFCLSHNLKIPLGDDPARSVSEVFLWAYDTDPWVSSDFVSSLWFKSLNHCHLAIVFPACIYLYSTLCRIDFSQPDFFYNYSKIHLKKLLDLDSFTSVHTHVSTQVHVHTHKQMFHGVMTIFLKN